MAKQHSQQSLPQPCRNIFHKEYKNAWPKDAASYHRKLSFVLGLASAITFGHIAPAAAQTAITSLNGSYQTGTSSSYSTTTANPCTAGAYGACGSPVTLSFGVGTANDLTVTGFNAGADSYSLLQLADSVAFRRINGQGAIGERQLMFFEKNKAGNTQISSSYTNSMNTGLLSNIANRGIDNTFSNDNTIASNNLERIDYIVDAGLNIAPSAQGGVGFLVLERGGNDPFKVAAITSLDTNGNPASFGPLKSVATSKWGNSGFSIEVAVMRREETEPAFRPSHVVPSQPIKGVFISLADLNAGVGQTIFGYALFSNDISNASTSNDLVNLTNFPTNTSGAGAGGLDLVAGGGIYTVNSLSTVSGTLYEDVNADNSFNPGEATLPDGVEVVLYQDSNSSGTYNTGEEIQKTNTTGSNGGYRFVAVADGTYRVFVNTNDANIPSNLMLGTSNNTQVVVARANQSGINFGFDKTLPSVLLVKRIVAINRGLANEQLFDKSYVDVGAPNDADNAVNWPGVPTAATIGSGTVESYIAGIADGSASSSTVRPRDEIEYTIPFLSNGGVAAQDVLVCDRIPLNTQFVSDAYNSLAPTNTGGGNRGILLNFNGGQFGLTNANDGDEIANTGGNDNGIGGYYFPAGVNPSTAFPGASVNCGGTNDNGSIVVDLSDIPHATGDGTPANAYGFIRFRVTVN